MKSTFAAALNPFAGLHPVSADPVEQEAARRASEASLREFPYYVERYGARARLFGTSDGAWLLTLCDADRATAERQVLWLGSVLSTRGMPRWMLQRHLEVLHGAVAWMDAARAARCRALVDAAGMLAALRRAHLADEDFRALGAGFAARVGPAWAQRLAGMGGIVAAAVADEADGVAGAVTAVTGWAADPARFPPEWVAAVAETVAEARGRLRSAVPG